MFLNQDLRDGIVLGEEWEQRLHERLQWANAVGQRGGLRGDFGLPGLNLVRCRSRHRSVAG